MATTSENFDRPPPTAAGNQPAAESNPFQSTTAPALARTPNSRRHFPRPRMLVILTIELVLIAVLRLSVEALDAAVVNIATFVLAFAAGLHLLIWFTFSSGYPRPLRYATFGLVLAVIASLPALFRVEHVSGSLVPKYVLRWTPVADRTLAKPAPEISETDSERAVDLATTTPEDFPRFLGAAGRGAVSGVQLGSDWRQQPPRQLWKKPIGAGWSGFAAVNGFAVTMEQRGDEEWVSCYEIKTGKLRWWHAIAARHQTVPGGIGPRSTPAIHEGRVYALGATGVLRCLDGATGQPIWMEDILKRIGTTPDAEINLVAWGRAGSPLIVGELVVVPFGGKAGGPFHSLAAYDWLTGDRRWQAGDRQISYASPTLATLGGVEQILSVNEDNVSGHDPRSGNVLWQHAWPGNSAASASCSQPVPVGGDRVFLSKAYGFGAVLISVSRQPDGSWQTAEVWPRKSSLMKTKFTNVVVRDGFAYGLSDGVLECVEIASGERQWKSGRYGHGQILLVGDRILALGEDGVLHLVAAEPTGFQELGEFPVLEGQTWNNLCLFGRRLLVRNGQQAACYELP